MLAFSPAAAQDQSLPPTTLGCENFKKNPDGAWVVVSEKPFQIGSTVVSINTGTMIRPKSVTLVGADIYSLLETKCRGSGNPG